MLIAVGAALVGALAYGAASVLQARAADGQSSAAAAVMRPAYLAGLLLDTTAWVMSLVAAHGLPLFVAQGVLASSVAVTAILSHRVDRTALPRRTAWASVWFVLAVAMLAASAGPMSSRPAPTWLAPALGGVLVVAFVTGFVPAVRKPVLQAVISGLAFAGTAVSSRYVHAVLHTSALTDPYVALTLGFSIVGVLALARALHDGRATEMTAVLWVTELLASSAVGVFVAGDAIRHGFLPVAGVGLVIAVVACHRLGLPGATTHRDPTQVVVR